MAIPHTLDEKLAGSRRLSQNATRCNTETIQGINYLKKGKIQSEDETSYFRGLTKKFSTTSESMGNEFLKLVLFEFALVSLPKH